MLTSFPEFTLPPSTPEFVLPPVVYFFQSSNGCIENIHTGFLCFFSFLLFFRWFGFFSLPLFCIYDQASATIKRSPTQRLRTDLGRSAGATIVIQPVWLT